MIPRNSSVRQPHFLGLLLMAAFVLLPIAAAGAKVLRMEVHDTLQPERARVFAADVERANREGYAAIVVDLSTPGGMSDSAGRMVAAMQQSAIPVIVWVGAPQTRVSGEGLRLIAAADLSLMNPQAFLTPLWTEHVGGWSPARQAAASQALQADLSQSYAAHGHETSAVEELAFGSHWFAASEAVESGLVDGSAEQMQDVLRAAREATFLKAGQRFRLNIASGEVDTARPGARNLLLVTLMNPDLAVILLTLGLLLVYLEINTPGVVIPGASGVLLALLAAYALRQLPVNGYGVLLCVLAAMLLLLEGAFAMHGILASAGVLALVVGLGILVNGPIPQLQVGWPTAVGAGLGFGGVTASLVVLGLEARRAKVKTGADAMLGWLAVAQTTLAPDGQILVRGELWKARLESQDSFVAAGTRVKVVRAEGTLLEVAAVPLGDGA